MKLFPWTLFVLSSLLYTFVVGSLNPFVGIDAATRVGMRGKGMILATAAGSGIREWIRSASGGFQ